MSTPERILTPWGEQKGKPNERWLSVRAVKYLLGLLLAGTAFLCPQQAQATFSAPTPQCDQGGSTSTFTTIACTATGSPGACATTGSLILVFGFLFGQSNTVNYAITDSVDGATGWITAINHNGTVGGTLYIFSKIATTNTCLTYTLTASPAATATDAEIHVWSWTGNAATAVPDCTAQLIFTSNADPTFSSGNCTTTFTDDLVVGTVSCPSVFGSLEFSTSSTPFTTLFNSDTSPAKAYTGENRLASGAGTVHSQWGSPTLGCNYSSFNGQSNVAAFKAADGSPASGKRGGHLIIGYHLRDGYKAHTYKIPWDNRKRKLQIVSI